MHKSRKVGKLKSPGIKMSTLELISYNKHKVMDKRKKKYCIALRISLKSLSPIFTQMLHMHCYVQH